MKKAILYVAAAAMFLFSCKKDHSGSTDKPAQKLYQVNLNLSGFTETISNSIKSKPQVNGLRTDAVTNYLKVLYYFVFDPNGQVLHSLVQDSTNANFGNISDNLPSGTYTVVIAAGLTGLGVYAPSANGNSITLNNGYMYYLGPWKDVFFNKFQLTVSGANVNQSVTGTRIAGQLEVNIEDAIPATASKLVISIADQGTEYSFLTEKLLYADTLVVSAKIPNTVIGTTNYKINNIILNTYAPFTVKIICYDAASKALGTAIVANVTCEKNTKTILSGKLFGSIDTFNVTLNSTWDPTPIIIPFSSSYGSQK
ncbi:FimB/Mfa2 family fimbrial subunit [Mucilaginibacter sp. OK098]|uniref:FimB/Mfa2 family fimbrial subunit n=1 Tax=Mucilaginibacter sp. OK098 TaxID=1855297 RepID=UPI000910A5DF|nr:FimB/Mfa2 family fimbrial subunit [Mucilaginibacter sp. OK098]SHM17727.1 hypothetical protein SAMN05216524_1011062 [Mucilaginibacter sp. OK098]